MKKTITQTLAFFLLSHISSTFCYSHDLDIGEEFNNTVELHFNAIKSRDIDSLLKTVNENHITLILPSGKYANSINEYIAVNKEWFNDLNWDITHEIVEKKINGNMGFILAKINYFDKNEDGKVYSFSYYLTLVFERSNDVWKLIFDQNTIIK